MTSNPVDITRQLMETIRDLPTLCEFMQFSMQADASRILKKMHPFPIYLMGKSYWSGLMEWMKNEMLSKGCVSEKDFELITITDDPEEVANGIERHYQRNRALKNF